MEKEYDIVIIGGGITGAIMAWKLSETTKKSILILEAGADRSGERIEMSLSYAASLKKSPRSPYEENKPNYLESPDGADDYYRPADGTPYKFKATYIKAGGGSTLHWLGNVPRYLPNDFKMQTIYGKAVDWPITYDDLEEYYCQAEEYLGVSGNHLDWDKLYGANRSKPFVMSEIWPAYSDTVLKKHLDGFKIDEHEIKIRVSPQARNSQTYQGRPACSGNSSCLPICPIQAKYDATVHLKLAEKNGVTILYRAVVWKIDKDENGLINKVYYKNWNKEEFTVKGKIVILAAHAIETPILLQTSNIANSSGTVGKYLMDHLQGYGVGMSNEPLYPFRGPPTISGIDVFRDGAFRKIHAAFRISLGNDGWGRWKNKNKLEAVMHDFTGMSTFLIGKDLRSKINETVIRLFRFSYSTEMLPLEVNRVVPHEKDISPLTGIPYPKIYFQADDESQYNQKAFQYASSVLARMFDKIGVSKENYHLISDNKEFSTAFHIMGTTRMGDNPKSSVVNSYCQSHDHANLFIVGPSVFPTGGTANPTLTAVALVLRTADYISKKN